MSTHASIGIYDNLSSCKACIAWRPTNNKSTSWIDMNLDFIIPVLSTNWFDYFFNYFFFYLIIIYFRRVLCCYYYGFKSLWLSIFILYCNLRLAIWSDPRKQFAFSNLGKLLCKFMS